MIATVTAAGGGASIHAPMSGSLTKSCDEAVHAATCPTGSTGRRRFYCAIGLCCLWPRQWIEVYAAFLHSNLLQR